MPTAVCDACGGSVYWRNVRGSSRPRQHGCGGRLVMAANVKVPAEHEAMSTSYCGAYLDALQGRLPVTSWQPCVGQGRRDAYAAGYEAGKTARGGSQCLSL